MTYNFTVNIMTLPGFRTPLTKITEYSFFSGGDVLVIPHTHKLGNGGGNGGGGEKDHHDGQGLLRTITPREVK